MSAPFSVTEVRNALRCPRIFTLGREEGRQVAFPVGASLLGATFHRLLEELAREANDAPAALKSLERGVSEDALALALGRWLLSMLVRELEARPGLASMPSEVDDLAEALRQFARYLAHTLVETGERPAAALEKTLRAAELELEDTVTLPGGREVRLLGRADALFAGPRGGFEVVEYKLTAEENDGLDRAQVALYRWLLARTRGLDATPLVLRFTPRLQTSRVPRADADALVERVLLPLLTEMLRWSEQPELAPPATRPELCAACPARAACLSRYPTWQPVRDAPPTVASPPGPDGRSSVPLAVALPSPPPAQEDAEGLREADALREKILAVLKKKRVTVEVVGPPLVSARVLTLEVRAARGSVKALDEARSDIEHQLAAAKTSVEYVRDRGRRLFRAARAKPRGVELSTLLAKEKEWLAATPGRFLLGEGLEGGVVRGDFSDPACAHLLVAGTTGSGKSVLLRGLAASLVHFHPPGEVQLTLVDPKRVTFQEFASRLGPYLAQPLLFEVETTLQVLDGLAGDMEARYALFSSARVQNVADYNATQGPAERLPRHVVIIDEFQDFSVQKSARGPFLAVLQRLGAKARAAGIHLVLATQRPDAKTVPGEIKANLPGKIALKVQSVVNSRIVLDREGAEALLGRGDLLADLGDGPVRAQAAMV